jgi:hypothetical protein
MKANNPMKVRYNHSIQGCLYGAKVQANVRRKLQTQLHFGGHFFCEFIRHQRNTTARNAHHHGCAGRPVLLSQSPVDSFAGQLGVETAQAAIIPPSWSHLQVSKNNFHTWNAIC